jgi:hypothetical protein
MTKLNNYILDGVVSAIAGFVISFALAQRFFDLTSRPLIDQLFLVLIPAVAVFVCLLFCLPFLRKVLKGIYTPARVFIILWAALSSFLTLFVIHESLLFFLFLFFVFLLLIIPSAPSIQSLIEAGGRRRVFGAWLFAFIASSHQVYRSHSPVLLSVLLEKAR